MNAPKISVIIPMYNAAKYVGDCLESLLAQTFQDFEVIIVDDCSTDSSRNVVESYAPKFNGRLALLQLDRNTGSGAVPRNTGLKIARGEYVFFADADDLLMLTAFEELYTLAKNFNAEVVYCEEYYHATADLRKIIVDGKQETGFTNHPRFESADLSVRVNEILNRSFLLVPWSKFVRRDFLIKHEIFFPHCKIAEDDIWTYALVFYAERFLRVPNVVYIHREAEDSVSRLERTPLQYLVYWINPIVYGIGALDKFMLKHEFFRQNPVKCYDILEYFIRPHIKLAFYHADDLAPEVAVDTLEKFFGKNFGEHGILFAHLISMINDYQQLLKQRDRQLEELAARLS